MTDTLSFRSAVLDIAGRLFPHGFDINPNPPNTLEELALTMLQTGRMVVTSHVTDDCEFDAPTYAAFRAWHDWCHVFGGHAFDLQGECAAVRMQLAMIYGMYGKACHDAWKPTLLRQIIKDNFGEDAFCPGLLGAAIE